ncbi:MAG: chemotaxis protein CheW [Chromatiales bacterium]
MSTSTSFTPLQSSVASLQEADWFGGQLQRERERRFGYVVCGAGFLVPRGVASEIVATPVTHLLPWLTPCIRGFFNQRGNVVPVFDLSPLFKREIRKGTRSHLLAIDSGERGLAVVIDELPMVLSCTPREEADMVGLPALVARSVQGVCTGGGRSWYEVDHFSLYRNVAEAALD